LSANPKVQRFDPLREHHQVVSLLVQVNSSRAGAAVDIPARLLLQS
jgi:hypothetical protein